MKLRDLLNSLSSAITDDFTEAMLLDLDVKIEIPHSCGTYSVHTIPRGAEVKENTHFSRAEGKNVTERYIRINTGYIS